MDIHIFILDINSLSLQTKPAHGGEDGGVQARVLSTLLNELDGVQKTSSLLLMV